MLGLSSTQAAFVLTWLALWLVPAVLGANFAEPRIKAMYVIEASGFIGAIPIWWFTFQVTHEWLLWIVGILLGMAYATALQQLAATIWSSKNWRQVVGKSAGFLAVFAVLFTAGYILLSNQDFREFVSDLVHGKLS